MVPAHPTADYVVRQAGLPLGLLEHLLDSVSLRTRPHQLLQRHLGRCVGQGVNGLGPRAERPDLKQPLLRTDPSLLLGPDPSRQRLDLQRPLLWRELAIAAALIGSPIVSRLRDPNRAHRRGLAFTGLSFACATLAWLAFHLGIPPEQGERWGVQPALFGRQLFRLDELSAPLVPAVALLHFLTGLATARTHMRRFSFSWSLAAEAILLATFSCQDPRVLIGLLVASTRSPWCGPTSCSSRARGTCRRFRRGSG